MKRANLWVAIPLFFLLSCSGTEHAGVKVQGLIKQPLPGEMVVIERLTTTELLAVDTVDVATDGSFTTYLDLPEASFVRFNFYGRQMVNVIVNGKEELIEVEVDGDRPDGFKSVSGSPDTDLLDKILAAEEKRRSDENMLNQEAIRARTNGDVQTFNDIVEQYYTVDGKNRQALRQVILDAAPSLAALYGANFIEIEKNIGFADTLVNLFESGLPGHSFTEDLKSKVSLLKRVSVGSDAPDISLPSPDGDVVSLSSLRGNYVLIDFWAAWCRPCRQENPNVVRLYNKYSQQNFEILGVSLDRTKEAWVKAIADDGLTWKHISDLKYFNSEAAKTYQVNAIPATYLIDPDGKIIAKGLRGETLRSKLEEIFG
ncbi:MAG: TlpA disulfide reductase family protein [Bacteroidota bacterium]